MRLTIARKLTAGLGILLCFGVGAMLVVYGGLATAGRDIEADIAEVVAWLATTSEPTSPSTER